MKPGDWVTHPKIQQVMLLEKIDDDTAWLRSPGAEGWPFPVWFALPLRELVSYPQPDNTEAPF
jgi:hypothetical protein